MVNSSCCFLTSTQVSQKAGKVVWYSQHFKNIPQFTVIHTVKGFSTVNKTEADVLWTSLAFPMIQQMLAIWSLVPLPFLNAACISESSQFTYCRGLTLKDFEHNLAGMWNDCNCTIIWMTLPFIGIGMKTDLFQSYGHCCVFQICWHNECSTFTASHFRIWNNSAVIPSPPLALFVVVLPKVYLASHSTMSGSRRATTSSWLTQSLRAFLYSSVYSCYLFLISSASVRSLLFLSFIVHIFAWNVPLVSSIFLKRSFAFLFFWE